MTIKYTNTTIERLLNIGDSISSSATKDEIISFLDDNLEFLSCVSSDPSYSDTVATHAFNLLSNYMIRLQEIDSDIGDEYSDKVLQYRQACIDKIHPIYTKMLCKRIMLILNQLTTDDDVSLSVDLKNRLLN